MLLSCLLRCSLKQNGVNTQKDFLSEEAIPVNCCRKRFLLSIFLPAVIVLLTFTPAGAWTILLESGAGYNDNVAESPEAEGSGFLMYHSGLTHRFSFSGLYPDIDLYADGVYYDYFDADDQYQMKAGTVLTWSAVNGRLRPAVLGEGLIYRDDLMIDDERNEEMVGGQLEWLYSARLTLRAVQTLRWADYTNPVLYIERETPVPGTRNPGGGPGPVYPGPGVPPGLRPGEILRSESRDDRLWRSALQGTIYINSSLWTDISLEYLRLDSSVDVESFREYALFGSLVWQPADNWEIFVTGGWQEADYDDTPRDIDRTDTIRTTGAGVSRFFGNLEVFGRVQWRKTDSDLAGEEYRQTVVQCGVLWSF